MASGALAGRVVVPPLPTEARASAALAAVDPELVAEQRYVDRAYDRLEAMRAAARRVADGYAEVGAGGTHQARLERDVAEEVTRRRLAALDIGVLPLCFGRLDL